MKRYFNIALSQYKNRNNFFSFLMWVELKIKKYLNIQYTIKDCNENRVIDIVIPTIAKDFETLYLLIESLKYIEHKINKIYIVSPSNDDILEFCKKNSIVHTNGLNAVGFGKKKIKYTVDGLDRSGWLYQQLIKLSSDNITESKDYLVIDSDTIFVNKNCFIEKEKYLFFTSEEWHKPYFETFKNIFGYEAPSKLSLTSHMMIFNHDKLKEMKQEIEKKHNKKWYEVYISSSNDYEKSCISDYDTYANWMLYNYPKEVNLYPFYNKSESRKNLVSLEELSKKYNSLKSISFHSYIDK